MRLKPSKVINALNLITDDDTIVRFYDDYVLVLINNVYKYRLYYEEKEVKKIELLRNRVKEAIEMLDKLREQIEKETNLKFKKRYWSYSFRYRYLAELPYEIYIDEEARYRGERITKVGITMEIEKDGFEFALYMIGEGFDKKRIYEKEEEILNLFRAFERIKKPPEELYKISSDVKVVLYNDPSYWRNFNFYYKVKIKEKELKIPARFSFKNGELKEELNEKEWKETLHNILKTELVEAL